MKKRRIILPAIILLTFLFLLPFINPQFIFASDSQIERSFNGNIKKEDFRSFRRLSTSKKVEYLEGLSEEDKKYYFNTLSKQEKEKILKKYSILDLQMGDEEREHLLPKELPAEQDAVEESPLKEQSESPGEPESLSKIEEIISGRFPTDIFRELHQYGYAFFKKSQTSFLPLRNVPVGPDYIIGPGDEVEIFMWGRLDDAYNIKVDSEGTLYLPKIGSLTVVGLTFGELKKLIRQKVEAITGVKVSVSMGRLRTIDVFIVGEAKNPATYSVSSLSTVISALYASGGPSKNGSLRGIKVFRNRELVVTLDLYAFFIEGMKNNDIRLKNGDTIFIPVLGPVAGVAGAVRRPAIYEMKEGQTIGEVIGLAGGMLPTGELQNVVVERIEGHKRRVIKSFNLDFSSTGIDENLNMPVKDFDVIKIYPIYERMRQVVYLEGHVKYPREYELKTGMRLLDIISSYNALLPEPYLPQAEIIRLMPPDLHPEIIEFNLGALLAGDGDRNLLLKDQDRIIVYDAWEKEDIPEVSIEGAVRNPGAYRLYKGMGVKDLIFQAGNLTHNAYLDKATVSRVVRGLKETDIRELAFSPGKAMAGMVSDNMTLERDDTVRIRKIPQYSQALRQKVYLKGEFIFPGEYSFSEGDRLSSVIEKAGGLSDHSYPFGATFYRDSVKKLQEERLKDYISNLEEDILTMSSQEAGKALDETQAKILEETLDSRKQLVAKLKTARPTGRMVIDLVGILTDLSSSSNLELRSGDTLVVEKRPDSVNIMGEVYNPTAIFSEENKNVSHYLKAVGGITPNGDKKQVYVVKANGSVISKTQESFFGMTTWDAGNSRWVMGFESTRLDPGDTIIVPKKVAVYPWLRATKDITQILYQMAVGAAVIIQAFD